MKKPCVQKLLDNIIRKRGWWLQCLWDVSTRAFFQKLQKVIAIWSWNFKSHLIVKKNAPNLPESVFSGNKTVQVVYLPPNISSLLQFLDHCIILSRLHIFIWYQLIINRLLTETDSNLDRMGSFKSFTINDTITFIKAAVS